MHNLFLSKQSKKKKVIIKIFEKGFSVLQLETREFQDLNCSYMEHLPV